MKTIILDGEHLTIEQLVAVGRSGAPVAYPAKVRQRIKQFRTGLERFLYEHPETPIYGVTRGCGDLLSSALKRDQRNAYLAAWRAHRAAPKNAAALKKRRQAFVAYLRALEEYQVRYIKAHNCGTGNPFPIEVVRAALAIRLNSFARGHSAVTLEMCQLIIDLLNRGVTPWVLEEGSVGASGDLIPLAMVGAVLLGLPEAKAYHKGKLLSAPEALRRAGLRPVALGAKEAMGITNGANFMAALGAFAVHESQQLLKSATVTAALSLEAIRGEPDAYAEFLNGQRPFPGQTAVARDLRALCRGSRRMTAAAQRIRVDGQEADSARERVQDRYSFRCVPQVYGAAFEAIAKTREAVTIEINSATDNPLLEARSGGSFKAYSGGNFHGQPLAVAFDYLKIALTGLTLITDKRTFSLLNHHLSFGLPQDLAADPAGSDTGLMIAQYASAARAGESRVLAAPSSVMSVSTSANQEDFVSMGATAALHLGRVIRNAQTVVGIELLCALRALQLSRNALPPRHRRLGRGTARAFERLNRILPRPSQDRYLRTDMEKMIEVVRDGSLVDIAGL